MACTLRSIACLFQRIFLFQLISIYKKSIICQNRRFQNSNSEQFDVFFLNTLYHIQQKYDISITRKWPRRLLTNKGFSPHFSNKLIQYQILDKCRDFKALIDFLISQQYRCYFAESKKKIKISFQFFQILAVLLSKLMQQSGKSEFRYDQRIEMDKGKNTFTNTSVVCANRLQNKYLTT